MLYLFTTDVYTHRQRPWRCQNKKLHLILLFHFMCIQINTFLTSDIDRLYNINSNKPWIYIYQLYLFSQKVIVCLIKLMVCYSSTNLFSIYCDSHVTLCPKKCLTRERIENQGFFSIFCQFLKTLLADCNKLFVT